jgi:type IV pilus assembly protein PilN
LNLALILLYIIIIGFLIRNMYRITANYKEIYTFAERRTEHKLSKISPQISDTDYNKVVLRIQFANSILQKRSDDWLMLLDRLEMLLPSGIAIRSIESTGKNEIIKISGSAKSFVSIIRFIEDLETSKSFTEVYLTDQSLFKIGATHRGINFSATCKALF